MIALWKGLLFAVTFLLTNNQPSLAFPQPAYLRVSGWKSCTETVSRGSYDEYCLPASKLEECEDEAWVALTQPNLLLQACPDDTPAESVGLFGALPPRYLSVSGWQKCTGTASHGTWQSHCLPATKLEECEDEAWVALTQPNLLLDACPSESVLPAIVKPSYLSVSGWQKCTGTASHGSWESHCLPATKLEECEDEAWVALTQPELLLEACPDDTPSESVGLVGGVGALPPRYLSVSGWQKCTGTASHGTWQSHCLPASKLEECEDEAWVALTQPNLLLDACPDE